MSCGKTWAMQHVSEPVAWNGFPGMSDVRVMFDEDWASDWTHPDILAQMWLESAQERED